MTITDRIGVGIFAAASAVTASLGVWQLHRRQNKIAQVADRRADLLASETRLESSTAPPPLFSRVQIASGTRYDGAGQFLVGPRAGPVSITGHGKGTGLSAGGLGYYVITPVTMPDGRTLLVNRGWCRRSDAAAALESVQYDHVAGAVAIIRPSEYSSADVTPSISSNIFVRMDAEAMSTRTDPNQAPVNYIADLLDAEGMSRVAVLRRRSVDDFLRFPVSPETHASYAFTWFALSAASAIIGVIRYRQKPQTRLVNAALSKS